MTPFFPNTEGFTKRPTSFFIVLTKWPPIFLLSSPKDPLFLYLVCHRKAPTLGVLSAHPRQFRILVPPAPRGYLSLSPKYNRARPTFQHCWKFSNHISDSVRFQITVLVRFGSVWFWLVTVILIVWPRSLLLCHFHKKLRIWWKKSFGFLSNR